MRSWDERVERAEELFAAIQSKGCELIGDKKQAEAALKQAADKLLANTLIENYQVELK